MKRILLLFGQIICLFSFIFMLFESQLVLKYAKSGLYIWFSRVLPLLLPFIILSKFWIRYKIPELFFRQIKKWFPKHPELAISLPIFLLGICSGFPIGALLISHYYKNGLLNKHTAESLLPLASFLSPMFVFGYIQPLIKGSEKIWSAYLIALYLPVFIGFFLLQFIGKYRKMHSFSSHLSNTQKKFYRFSNNKSSIYKKSLSEEIWIPSLEIIFTIGIYMMIFSILSGLLTNISWLNTNFFIFLLANLEVTTGIHLLHTSGLYSKTLLYTLSATTASFGGICTMAQVQSVISTTDLSIKKYVWIKLLTASLSLILCHILF